jgi:Bacterial low temperature requirement A protein (LtrA)
MAEDTRVSTLELFFDLVFVFTITQVAQIVEHHASWPTAAQALVELAVIYWMYGGYAWLTNTLGSRTQRQRVVLLLGMAAFLVVSLAVPRAFGHDGVAFGYAYLLLNVVHLVAFATGGVPGAARAMWLLGSINLLACARDDATRVRRAVRPGGVGRDVVVLLRRRGRGRGGRVRTDGAGPTEHRRPARLRPAARLHARRRGVGGGRIAVVTAGSDRGDRFGGCRPAGRWSDCLSVGARRVPRRPALRRPVAAGRRRRGDARLDTDRDVGRRNSS